MNGDYSVAGLVNTLEKFAGPPPVEEKTEEQADEKAEKAEKAEAPKATAAPAAKAQGAMNQREAAAVANQLENWRWRRSARSLHRGLPPRACSAARWRSVPSIKQRPAAQASASAGTISVLAARAAWCVPAQPASGSAASALHKKPAVRKSAPHKRWRVRAATPMPASRANAEARSATRLSVIAKMKGGFRNCYQKGLNENPDAQGSIRLTIQIGPGGEVSNVTASSTGNLSPGVVACVQARARAGQFDPPDGGSAVIVVPVTFVKQ